MSIFDNVEGLELTDAQKTAIQTNMDAATTTKVDAATATTTAELKAFQEQIKNLEKIKAEGKLKMTEQEEALAKSSGDYTKLQELKDAEWTEKLNLSNARVNELEMTAVNGTISAERQKIVGLFADASKVMAEGYVQTLVSVNRDDTGKVLVSYKSPDGSEVESLDKLLEAVKGFEGFAAHIKADSAQGGGNPKPAGAPNQGAPQSKKQVESAIAKKFGLVS